MAFTIDAAAEGDGGPSASSWTITSVTIASGASALIMLLGGQLTSTFTTTATWDVATANEALTIAADHWNNRMAAVIGGRLSPTAGTLTLTINHSAAITSAHASVQAVHGGSTSVLAAVTATSDGDTDVQAIPRITITPTSDDSIIFAVMAAREDAAVPSGDETSVWDQTIASGGDCAGAQYFIQTTAAAKQMAWSDNGSPANWTDGRWSAVAISYDVAAAAAAASFPSLTLLGVG